MSDRTEARVIPLHPDVTLPDDAATSEAPPAPTREPAAWERSLAAGMAFLRRRITGEYDVDEFGFDPDLTETVAIPALRPLYQSWFRTEVTGIGHVPDTGGALLVANHSGGLWALDAAMTAVAVHDEHPAQRHLRLLGADLVFATPLLGEVARKTGTTLACNADAERLLARRRAGRRLPGGFQGHRQAVQ